MTTKQQTTHNKQQTTHNKAPQAAIRRTYLYCYSHPSFLLTLPMKKLLKMADARTKENCRQLFSRLIDTSLRAQLTVAVQDPAFAIFLVGMMDRMGLQANNNVVNRLYSMTILQAGNFDNLYDNEGGFRGMIRALLGHVQENSGGPFSGLVTPDNTPGRGGGGGGDAGGGGSGGGDAGGDGAIVV